MSETKITSGRQLVVALYLIVVSIAAIIGFILGLARPEGLDPELFGVIQLPPTPLGMALYGGLTLATILGGLLALVVYVSRYDTAEPAEPK